MSVIIFILILSFLVVIHEMGHLLAARWAGMKVKEFGVGYPPRVARLFSWKETEFSLNWIPFGGFVSIDGEDGYLSNEKPKKGSFASVSPFKQLVVITAGVVVNFLFGALVFAVLFSYFGIPQFSGAKITEIAADSPAQEVGLQPEEYILALHRLGDPVFKIASNEDVTVFISQHRGQVVDIITAAEYCDIEVEACKLAAQEREVYLRTSEETPEGQGSLGIVFQSSVEYQRYVWYEMPIRGMMQGFRDALDLGVRIMQLLSELPAQLFQTGSSDVEVSGPVGIAYQVQKQDMFASGPVSIVTFAAMLSINLAVMNILPIPALDGGRAVFIVLRMFVSSTKVKQLEYYSNYLGFALLLSLIIGITLKDIWSIIVGSII